MFPCTRKHLLIGGIAAGVVVLFVTLLPFFFGGRKGGTEQGRVVAARGATSTAPPPAAKVATNPGLKSSTVPSKPDARPSEAKPQHRVRITRPFYLGVYEVTQAEYEEVMGTNPSQFKASGRTAPVDNVSWNGTQEFCKKLSSRAEEQAAGRRYRLPTEAEWEYACRSGTTTRWSPGDDESLLGQYAWYKGNAGNRTHPVGEKKPNGWGLHDMHGNLWEWCADWFGPYPSGAVTDPLGAGPSADRVFRGGSWSGDAGDCQSAFRYWLSPGYRSLLGFRLAAVWSGG